MGPSKARGQPHPDDQHLTESDPGLSTGRHLHLPRPGARVAVVEEPLQDSQIPNEPEGLAMRVTRGMRRRSTERGRRAQLVTSDPLIAGVDPANKKKSVVVFV
ncbi:MAG TPA: hypothetical protein VKY90_21875, partial [Candidatus Dormibacteraeota bacterium]|nr:hypothetical protein [Candidatus Dormibacteraeota bacterium]